MPRTNERPPPGVEAVPEFCHATQLDDPRIAPSATPPQAEILRFERPPPDATAEARLGLIREELYGSMDEIRLFAERGLRALEVENDLDLGRAFDQSVKHFVAVAENLQELIAVKTEAAQ
jgi:hypothetical protein